MGFALDDARGIFVIVVLAIVFGGTFAFFLGLYVLGAIIAILIIVVVFIFQFSSKLLSRRK